MEINRAAHDAQNPRLFTVEGFDHLSGRPDALGVLELMHQRQPQPCAVERVRRQLDLPLEHLEANLVVTPCGGNVAKPVEQLERRCSRSQPRQQRVDVVVALLGGQHVDPQRHGIGVGVRTRRQPSGQTIDSVTMSLSARELDQPAPRRRIAFGVEGALQVLFDGRIVLALILVNGARLIGVQRFVVERAPALTHQAQSVIEQIVVPENRRRFEIALGLPRLDDGHSLPKRLRPFK